MKSPLNIKMEHPIHFSHQNHQNHIQMEPPFWSTPVASSSCAWPTLTQRGPRGSSHLPDVLPQLASSSKWRTTMGNWEFASEKAGSNMMTFHVVFFPGFFTWWLCFVVPCFPTSQPPMGLSRKGGSEFQGGSKKKKKTTHFHRNSDNRNRVDNLW